jgi:hypothetical protein
VAKGATGNEIALSSGWPATVQIIRPTSSRFLWISRRIWRFQKGASFHASGLVLCSIERGAAGRPTCVIRRVQQKKKREGSIVVRSVVSVELADKLRQMATEGNCTLSDMIALLLARAVKKN